MKIKNPHQEPKETSLFKNEKKEHSSRVKERTLFKNEKTEHTSRMNYSGYDSLQVTPINYWRNCGKYIFNVIWFQDDFWEESWRMLIRAEQKSNFSKAWYLEQVLANNPW